MGERKVRGGVCAAAGGDLALAVARLKPKERPPQATRSPRSPHRAPPSCKPRARAR